MIAKAKAFLSRRQDQSAGEIIQEMAIILRSKINVKRILKTIDLTQYKVIENKYRQALTPGIQYGLEFNLRHIYRLNLHHLNPLNILDIGPGYGYFAYLCKYYGHHVMTIDLDTTEPVYSELSSFFDINQKPWKVLAYQVLPVLGPKFDLITAHHICFDNHDRSDAWGEPEYTYFLKDLRDNQLTETGRVYLLLNRNKLLNFFAGIGTAHTDGDKIYFISSKKCLDGWT
jgi:hypothetical protein